MNDGQRAPLEQRTWEEIDAFYEGLTLGFCFAVGLMVFVVLLVRWWSA